MDHRIDRRGFSRAGTSGKDHQSAARRLDDGFSLHLIQFRAGTFFNLFQLTPYGFPVFLTDNVQFMEHAGTIQFQIIILSGIDQFLLFLIGKFPFFQYDLPVNGKIHQVLGHILHPDSQKFLCPCREDFLGQIHMPLCGSLV